MTGDEAFEKFWIEDSEWYSGPNDSCRGLAEEVLARKSWDAAIRWKEEQDKVRIDAVDDYADSVMLLAKKADDYAYEAEFGNDGQG